jgi:hypothetical protein
MSSYCSIAQKGFNTKWSTHLLSSFWLPRNLSNYMDRQARTRDTVLVRCREMTDRSQTLPWWLEGGGVKTTEKNASAQLVLFV